MRTHRTILAQPEPELMELVRELRDVLGMFTGSMAKSPQEAWDEAIIEVMLLRLLRRPS